MDTLTQRYKENLNRLAKNTSSRATNFDCTWDNAEKLPTSSAEYRNTVQYKYYTELGRLDAVRMQTAARKKIAGALYYPMKHSLLIGIIIILLSAFLIASRGGI